MSNSNCNDQTCSNNCCNYYGWCTEDYNTLYHSSLYTDCYYYYSSDSDSTDSSGIIAGAIVGGVFLFIIIAVIVHYKRKRDFEATQQIQQMNNANKNK